MENLQIKERIDMQDNFGLKGRVILRDPLTGEIVSDKNNLIVLRSRAFILELLFKQLSPSGSNYINNTNRSVCLFKIGEGGADITTSPFQAVAPKFNAEDLNAPLPFIIEDPNKNLDPNKKANPSFVEFLTDDQKKKYYLSKEYPDGSVRYFGKIFEPDSQRLKVNKTIGEVYMHVTLAITPDEARGFIYNELGLVLAEYDEINNVYKDEELFSMITLDSDALKSLTRGVLIEYLIYA